jgi:hypothetical protein
VAVCIVILAISLSVGLGIGLKHNNPSSSAAGTNLTTSTNSNPTTVSSSIPTSTSANNSSASNSPNVGRGALNDTFVAALTSADNNRHVFFQDFNGSLRHSVYNNSANSWASHADYITTPLMPQRNTPLAAISLVSQNSEKIHLFYVGSNNSFAAVLLNTDGNVSGVEVPMNLSILAATNTRVLRIIGLPYDPSGKSAGAVAMYEAPNGNVTLLTGSFQLQDSFAQWLWQDIDDVFYSHLQLNGLWLSPPVNLAALAADNYSIDVGVTFFNTRSLTNSSATPIYISDISNWAGLRMYSFQILNVLTNTW